MLGGMLIISNEGIALREDGNMELFGRYYFAWIGSLFDGLGSITGYVVNVDWLPDTNSTGNSP